MKKIITSAPGNVMLMGEHAVLFGHPAIVCAVEQRLTVTLTPRDDRHVHIVSALGTFEGALDDILSQTIADKSLSFVLASIQHVKPTRGFTLHIESEFSHTVGLGSSAAVVAACVYALTVYRDDISNANHLDSLDLNDVFDTGLAVIHAVQQRGSGSDLAASVFGGIIAYEMANAQNDTQNNAEHNRQDKRIMRLLEADAFNQQHSPQLDLYYCGYKTPTPTVLARVAEAAEALPDIYQALYQQMGAVATQSQAVIAAHDWQTLGKLMNIYHGLMDALGVSDAKLSELIYQARAQTGVLGAKISGSGLGDCIITLSRPDAERIAHLNDNHIDARISVEGLTLEVTK